MIDIVNMGNAPSSRRVTIVNDDVVGVVKVSENVVRRLRGDSEKSSEPSVSVSKESVQSSDNPAPAVAPSGFVPFTPPEPYSSTLEQRQKYHEEFKKSERSWQNRIKQLEAQNRQLFDAANEKIAATLADVETNYMKNSYAPVCPDKQQTVKQCYKENSKYPLNCSREVHEFMECVDKVRMTALTK